MSLSIEPIKNFVNNQFTGQEPWKIVSITASSVLAGVWVWNFVFQPESISSRAKKITFKLFRKIPAVQQKVEKELAGIAASFHKDVTNRFKTVTFIDGLRNEGMTPAEVLKIVNENLQLGHYDWKKGYVSGAVYFHSEELINLLTKVYGLASYTNPLHPDVFPGVNKMEAEVVRISAQLFHGGPDACGTMTSGGTESILMACKAYRDYGRDVKGIKYPEMILPRTAHAAFEKAAAYFSITVRHVDIDPETTAVCIKQVKKAISRNTIVIVGSVPNFPYGTMDDMEALSGLGQYYDIPVHADCCLGGFLSVFMPQAGFSMPPFDFALPGITSISADTHKYGYAPKGSSIILYSHPKYLHYQYCVTPDWPGGVYGSPTVCGSRAGGIIAACWATLMFFGMKGYVDATKKVISTARYIENELLKIKEIFIFGKPVTSVIALGSNKFHIYRLSEFLIEKGWSLNPLQFPPGIHLCVTHMHVGEGVADRFINDVKDGIAEIMKNPDLVVEGKMAMYGMSQSIGDRSIVDDVTKLFLDSLYYTPKVDSITPKQHANGFK